MKKGLLLLLLFVGVIFGQNLDPEKDITVKGFYKKLQGNNYQCMLEINIADGLHITEGDYYYLNSLDEKIKISDMHFTGKVSHKDYQVFHGTSRIIFKALIPANMITKPIFEFSYQACTEGNLESCFPPIMKELTLDDFTENSNKITTYTSESENNQVAKIKNTDSGDKSLEQKLFSVIGDKAEEDGLSKALKWSIWIFIFAFLGGILDSFTPCVYPIIPVVISYMGSRSGNNKKAGLFLSLFFVLGLSITYSIVGLLASFIGEQFGVGTLVGNPFVMVFVALVFFTLSLSMFGFYDINLMSSTSKTKMMQKNFSGPIGAIFLGALSGVIAAPCVGPVLAALLLHVTLVGDILYGWLLLMTFAFGLGLLFLVIGTFSGALNTLPKAGGWMVNIKKFFGVIMVLVALYFIKPLFNTEVFNLISGLTIAFFSYFMIAKQTASLAYTNLVNTVRLFFRTIALILIIISSVTLLDITPPASFTGNLNIDNHNKSEVNFHKESNKIDILDEYSLQSKETNKLIIIDIWAEWCLNCKELDKTIWNDKKVIAEINKNYLPLKLDFSSNNDFTKYYRKKFFKYGASNPPVVMILDENQKVLKVFQGIITPADLLPVLKKLALKK